jgi:SulP family sulfate permease
MSRDIINPKTITSDVVAGLTLGIESIPDALASGVLAGVNPIHALYAVMLSTPVGALFSSSVFISVQTTSAMSLVVASVPQISGGDDQASMLFTLALLTGLFMLLAGLLKMGSLLRFVPHAVMTGFVNGVAVLIILGQLGDFTGYSSDAGNKVTQTIDLLFNVNQMDLPTLAVGTLSILLIVALGRTRLGAFSMVVALLASSLLVALLDWESVTLVKDIAQIPDSLPRPALPDLSGLGVLIVPALSLAIVGLVQGAGVGQNYTNPDGTYPDASGDFVGQGAANIGASFFQGMPVGGSLSATALVVSSGAKSRLANIFAGIVIAVTLILFGAAVGKLAMPALAGMLIVVGFQTLKPQDVEMVWRTGATQQAVMATTFALTLLVPLQYAVLCGVGLAVLLFVIRQSNQVTVKEWVLEEGQLPHEQAAPELLPSNQATVLIPYGSLFFAAAPIFEEQLPKLEEDTRYAVALVNLRGHQTVGSTFLEILERYAEELRDHKSRLMLVGVHPDVKEQLERTGQIDLVGEENVFVRTAEVGESVVIGYNQALEWIAEVSQADSEPDSTLTEQGPADAGPGLNGEEGEGKPENN